MGLFGRKHDAFISYKSKDVNLARVIADRLTHSGRSVWFAENQVLLVERDLFQDAIDRGIRKSRLGIALTNDDYARSEYCEKEMVQLLQYCGADKILEVKVPPEPETHHKYPELAKGRSHVFAGDPEPVLEFIAQKTGWKIRPPLRETSSAAKEFFQGVCLGRPYGVDVSGWELVERSFQGGGPCYGRRVEGFEIFWNLQYGEELSAKAYDARLGLNQKDDRALYDELCEYARGYFTRLRPGSKVAGVHLFFLDDVSHFAVTYRAGRFWKRRYSIMLSHPGTNRVAEFVITFQFPGSFRQYCRYCELMDKLVRTLRWDESTRRVAREPSDAARRDVQDVRQGVDDQPKATRLNSEGVTLARQGRLPEAIASWEKALACTTQPELRGMILFNLGRAYERMGNPARAIEVYAQSVGANPAQFNALSNIGSIYLQQNKPKEALPYLEEAAKKNPNDYITVNNLILCHERLGNRSAAQTWKAALRRLKP